ncbi:MAG: hypothetical protein ACI9U1_002048, partial [Porticoccaceae bacterium]
RLQRLQLLLQPLERDSVLSLKKGIIDALF